MTSHGRTEAFAARMEALATLGEETNKELSAVTVYVTLYIPNYQYIPTETDKHLKAY